MSRTRGVIAVVAMVATLGTTGCSSSDTQPRRIPKLVGATVQQSYARLHGNGLKVTISRAFVISSLVDEVAVVEQMSPAAGHRLSPGSTVSLQVGCSCVLGSAAVPRHIPSYRVPNFVGEHPSAPTRWVQHKDLYLTENFKPLIAADGPDFDANYRIVDQWPSPGAALRLGVSRGGFLPTPLVVWLSQTR